MRIAVTGGSGFLGSAIIEALSDAGHEVWAFDRTSGHDILGDLSCLRGAERVVHLAGVLGTAELFDDPELAIDVNVRGTLRILQWCRQHKAGYTGITMPAVFPSVYTATKLCADRLAHAWHEAYGVPVSIVRAFNAFGPGQKFGEGHPQKVVPTFAVKAWRGQPLPVWGDGTQTMDLISATELANVFAEVVDQDDSQVFDGGSGIALTVNQLAKMINEMTGNQAGIEYFPMRTGEVPTHICASGIGWERLSRPPMFRLDELRETVMSYKAIADDWTVI